MYLRKQDAGKGLYEQKAESILLTLLYKVNALHTLARNLMQLIAPGAPETGAASAAQTAAPAQAGGASNTVEELKQYKSLLDAGVITEEEFAAKKRQLLGI